MNQMPPMNNKNTKVKILILFLVVVGFITTFITGFILARLLASEARGGMIRVAPGKNDIAFPVLEDDNLPTVPQDSTKFIPGKHYFDDTIILVSKKDPSINLVATVTPVIPILNFILMIATIATLIYFHATNNLNICTILSVILLTVFLSSFIYIVGNNFSGLSLIHISEPTRP